MDPRENWLVPYIRVQARSDVEIDRLLREAARDAAKAAQELADTPGIGAATRLGQLITAQSALYKVLHSFWERAGNTVRAGQSAAQRAALEASFDWDDSLLSRAIPNQEERAAMKRYLVASADRNVEAMIARALGGARIPLSQQVWKTEAISRGWLDRVINSALARGASANEIARLTRDHIRPNTRGGVSYAAKRLARSEINNAYHAQAIGINSDKPWNTGVKWNLSRSHPEPDICDVMATKDQHELGGGVYPPTSVPNKPHPQCFCYITPKTVSSAEFIQQFEAGIYDIWLDSHYGPELGTSGRTVA